MAWGETSRGSRFPRPVPVRAVSALSSGKKKAIIRLDMMYSSVHTCHTVCSSTTRLAQHPCPSHPRRARVDETGRMNADEYTRFSARYRQREMSVSARPMASATCTCARIQDRPSLAAGLDLVVWLDGEMSFS